MTQYTSIHQNQAIHHIPVPSNFLETHQANFIFAQNIKSASKIENGRLLIRDKRARKYLDPEYQSFLCFLPWLHHHRISLAGFQLNPYWEEICDLIGYSQYGTVEYSLANADAIYVQFKHRFLQRRIALVHSIFIEPILETIKSQKAVFKRCLDKHKQMNCLLVDLPCIFVHSAIGLLNSEDEPKLIKMVRKWLERLHQSTELAQKLYDVQWRIVKSLNGIYSVQALLYIVGNEANYSDFILQEWKGTCLAKGYEIQQGSQYLIRECYCYFADSDMRCFWRKQIEILNEPLNIYRYKSGSISYRWNTYTGNIPPK